MSQAVRSPVRNHLLASLSREDFGLLQPHLEPVSLNVQDVLVSPHEKIEHVYFLEGGLASLVQEAPDGNQSEVGMLGQEGMSGFSVVLGADRTPHRTFIQVAGQAMRLRTADLRLVLCTSPTLHARLLHYVNAVFLELAETAFANARFTLEKRLARWMLMAADRLQTNDLPLTHEFLALTLGVRRPGVTTTMHVLEGEHAIRSKRSHVTILDRNKLQTIAGPSYGSWMSMASIKGSTEVTLPSSSVIS